MCREDCHSETAVVKMNSAPLPWAILQPPLGTGMEQHTRAFWRVTQAPDVPSCAPEAGRFDFGRGHRSFCCMLCLCVLVLLLALAVISICSDQPIRLRATNLRFDQSSRGHRQTVKVCGAGVL